MTYLVIGKNNEGDIVIFDEPQVATFLNVDDIIKYIEDDESVTYARIYTNGLRGKSMWYITEQVEEEIALMGKVKRLEKAFRKGMAQPLRELRIQNKIAQTNAAYDKAYKDYEHGDDTGPLAAQQLDMIAASYDEAWH